MSKLSTLKDNKGKKTYKLVTSFNNDSLDVTILDENDTFRCQVQIEDAVDFANSFQMDVDSYLKTLHQELTGKTSSATVSVITDQFTVYKNRRIIYFKKRVERCNYNFILDNVLETIFTENADLQSRVNALEEEKLGLLTECSSLRTVLAEHARDNADFEKKLYSSFVQLLNEKKRRIQFLTDLVESGTPSKRSKIDDLVWQELPDETMSDYQTPDQTGDDHEYQTDDDLSHKDDDEENNDDLLLSSPVPSPTDEVCSSSTSLPKRNSTKSSLGVSCRDDTQDRKVSPGVQEAKTQESVKSSEAFFSTQDILDRVFN